MEFKYNGSCFQADVRYKTNHITALCDTGATYTSIDIHSLSILIGHSAKAIYEQAINWIKRGYKYSIVHTASGSVNRVISIQLSDIKIHDKLFQNFYIKLNVDNELWKTDGIIKINNKEISVNPSILIGHDIIRACDLCGDSEKIMLSNFDEKFYIKIVRENFKDVLHLYQSNTPILPEQTNDFDLIKKLKKKNLID